MNLKVFSGTNRGKTAPSAGLLHQKGAVVAESCLSTQVAHVRALKDEHTTWVQCSRGRLGPSPSTRNGLKTVMSLILACAQNKAEVSLIAAIGINGENFQFQVRFMVITTLIPLYPVSWSYTIHTYSNRQQQTRWQT